MLFLFIGHQVLRILKRKIEQGIRLVLKVSSCRFFRRLFLVLLHFPLIHQIKNKKQPKGKTLKGIMHHTNVLLDLFFLFFFYNIAGYLNESCPNMHYEAAVDKRNDKVYWTSFSCLSQPFQCYESPWNLGLGFHQSITCCHWSPLPDLRDLVLFHLPFDDAHAWPIHHLSPQLL